MENASKALIIAGALLIAIMIVSLSVLVFKRIGGKAKEMTDMTEQEIASFNSKIRPYLGKAVPGSTVNALLQYCISNNISAKKAGNTNKAITVINGSNNSTRIDINTTSYDEVTSNKIYEVSAKTDENGLLTTITLKVKN